jgi:hypothetical protein
MKLKKNIKKIKRIKIKINIKNKLPNTSIFRQWKKKKKKKFIRI